jgi:exonuclease III
MSNKKLWKIHNWNIRGINAEEKCLALANKINESGCDIICLQETKRQTFDLDFLKKFCPRKFNKFEFLPSVGASGGIITIWNSNIFEGEVSFTNEFSLSIKFICKASLDSWILTNIYGPCQAERKARFIDWFANIDMPDDTDWLIVGDFNFIRSPSDRNKRGGGHK